jgi:hypothetical protein
MTSHQVHLSPRWAYRAFFAKGKARLPWAVFDGVLPSRTDVRVSFLLHNLCIRL